MKKGKLFLSIIILTLITIVLASLAQECKGFEKIQDNQDKLDKLISAFFIEYFIVEDLKPFPKEVNISYGIEDDLPDIESDSFWNSIDSFEPPLKDDPPIPDSGAGGDIANPGSEGSLLVGQDPNIDFSQIVSSSSTPPQDQIPVVNMPQDTPDIPQQDDQVTVADAEPPPDSPIKQPDDSSPVGNKPDDEPQDTPDTTEEESSYGEQEQPQHEHDILTYYEPDIYPNSTNTLSITINVNTVTGEVDGHYDFSGFIGDSGERSAVYDFSSYLDSDDSFTATSTSTIYEDGQDIGEATLTITGELASDLSLIAGEIIDTSMGGLAVIYYAYLISQSEEQPETEDY
jgi:hypothetical protein